MYAKIVTERLLFKQSNQKTLKFKVIYTFRTEMIKKKISKNSLSESNRIRSITKLNRTLLIIGTQQKRIGGSYRSFNYRLTYTRPSIRSFLFTVLCSNANSTLAMMLSIAFNTIMFSGYKQFK